MPRAEVPAALDVVLTTLQRTVRRIERLPETPEQVAAIVELALQTHAALIRIHPFEDGNGRTCRMFVNWILGGFGLRPVPVEVPHQEYIDVLNHYYRTQDIQPLVDLFLRLYDSQLSEAGGPPATDQESEADG